MSTRVKPDWYAAIRDLILRREVLPNERLVEADLAARLGTNRANVRTALARLEQEGLVVSEPNRGSRVRLVTEVEAVEIFEVRAVLEVLAVGQAVGRAKKRDCERLRMLHGRMRSALDGDDYGSLTAASRALHEEIWRLSNHQTAIRSLTMLNSQLVRFRFQSITMPGRAGASLAEHEAIIDAVCAGDAEAARRAMRTYFDSAIVSLKRVFEIEAKR